MDRRLGYNSVIDDASGVVANESRAAGQDANHCWIRSHARACAFGGVPENSRFLFHVILRS